MIEGNKMDFITYTNDRANLCDALERLIDRHGVATVCDALGGICYDKAEHIRTNWQDRALASKWSRLAAKFHAVEVWVRKVGPQ